MTAFLSGYFSIVGLPNVGKSTLVNRLVGHKVSIISKKAQTTRNKITGVLTEPGIQMVFLDTPGVSSPKNRLGEYMSRTVGSALKDVEAILYVVDPILGLRERDEALFERIRSAKTPIVGVINKSDISSAAQVDAARLYLGEKCAAVFVVSADTGDGLTALKEHLKTYLIEGPQFFPDDMYTDQPERLLIAECIREKALDLLRDEVPHGLGIDIDKIAVREDGGLTDINATINCEWPTHKGIIIGKDGSMLKKIGISARKDIEELLDTHVNLQLYVKVREGWRNSLSAIREFGYE